MVRESRQVGDHVFGTVESAVIVHRGFSVVLRVGVIVGIRVEVLSKAHDTIVGKDAKHVSLVVVELGRSFAAEHSKLVVEEGLNACKTEMGEVWAFVEQSRDSLS